MCVHRDQLILGIGVGVNRTEWCVGGGLIEILSSKIIKRKVSLCDTWTFTFLSMNEYKFDKLSDRVVDNTKSNIHFLTYVIIKINVFI
jgi:hypothetical protein